MNAVDDPIMERTEVLFASSYQDIANGFNSRQQGGNIFFRQK